LLFHSQGYKDALFPVIQAGQLLDLDNAGDEFQTSKRSLIRLFENDLTDDNSGSEYFGLLQSSRDAFQQAAAFNWGQARFRIRD
jgi:hypothetical protein